MLENNSNFTNCSQVQTFDNLSKFFKCFSFFAKQKLWITFFGFLLFFLILVSNLILAKKLLKHTLCIYDRIALAMCAMDLITCFIDYPFYIIGNLFGYFPLNSIIAYIWAVYDNNINTTTALHMLYMSVVLLKSVKRPLQFKNDFIVKQFRIMILLIWTIGLLLGFSISISLGIIPYTLEVNFHSNLQQFLLSFFFWFVILMSLLMVGIILMFNMNILKNKRISFITNTDGNSTNGKKIKKRIRTINLHSQLKIVLLVFTFWIQWMIPCTFYVLNALLHFLSDQAMYNIYWLTYTVCFTDPIVIYLLNPKIGTHTQKNNKSKSSIKK